ESPSRIGATGFRRRTDRHSPNMATSKRTGVKKMVKVKRTSTIYLTSRKKRLAAERKMARPAARLIRDTMSRGNHNQLTPGKTGTRIRMKTTASTLEAIKRSKSCEKMALIGKMSFGK